MLPKRYEIIQGFGNHPVLIGSGSSGQVKLALDRYTGEQVAVKVIHRIQEKEILFQKQFLHPNIVRLKDFYFDEEQETTFMILEYVKGGTLFEKLNKQKIPTEQIKKLFRDVCAGIAYLHAKGVMHRDLKPQNILLTGKGTAKLCDFGFAAEVKQRTTLCGTYEYMSPQMIQNRPYDNKIDIWALGILLFEMIEGRAPFRGDSPAEVLNEMKKKIFFSPKFRPQEISLIKSILRVSPSKRPTIEEILDNPYFYEEDSVSTKDSDSQVFSPTKREKSHNNIVQQNLVGGSYPFYTPKQKINESPGVGFKRPDYFRPVAHTSPKHLEGSFTIMGHPNPPLFALRSSDKE